MPRTKGLTIRTFGVNLEGKIPYLPINVGAVLCVTIASLRKQYGVPRYPNPSSSRATDAIDER